MPTAAMMLKGHNRTSLLAQAQPRRTRAGEPASPEPNKKMRDTRIGAHPARESFEGSGQEWPSVSMDERASARLRRE